MPKLIAAYGEWWDPESDAVEWGSPGPGNQGKLLATEQGKRQPLIDVWNQRGIYVLFQDWSVVYVGKTGGQPLGRRLKQHRSDDVAGRWDRFSWYGVTNVNLDGKLGSTPLPSRQMRADDVIGTLEAVLIRVTAPALNRRRETVPQAKLLVQPTPPARPLRTYLADIEKKLDELGARIGNVEASAAPE